MLYTRVNWQDDVTELSAKNLNNMDSAIYDLSEQFERVFVGSQINGAVIIDNSISGDKITNLSITNNKIETGAITGDKIDLYQITTAHIINESITTEKIANYNVTTDKLADYCVTSSKIENGAVGTPQMNSLNGITPVGSGMVLMSDGNGNVEWGTISIPSGSVTSVRYNGTTYTPVSGVVTFSSVQADYNEADTNSPAYIKNKPQGLPSVPSSIPSGGSTLVVVPDQTSPTGYAFEWQQGALPEISAADAGKVATVGSNGKWTVDNPEQFSLNEWVIKEDPVKGFIIDWIGA